jgi:hypothetical protein
MGFFAGTTQLIMLSWMREFRMLEFKISSPPWVTLAALLHSHRSCAVHRQVKRTGILTDRWKGIQAGTGPVYVDARKQSGGCRGRHLCTDLLHTAHRPGNVEVQEQCFTEQPREFCFRC